MSEFSPQAFIAWAQRPNGDAAAEWVITRAEARALLIEQADSLLRERLRYHAAHQAMCEFRDALEALGECPSF